MRQELGEISLDCNDCNTYVNEYDGLVQEKKLSDLSSEIEGALNLDEFIIFTSQKGGKIKREVYNLPFSSVAASDATD